jgi:hypothetical protein
MTGLAKQVVTLNFGNGVDTKTDPKLVVPGKLVELENAVFEKGGSLQKRFGNRLLATKKIDGTDITDGDSLAAFNDELLLFSGQKVFSLSEAANKWIDKGSAVSVVLNTKQIIKNTASQTIADSALASGIALYAWEDSRGGIRAAVYDETTGTPIVPDSVVAASGSRPRCLSLGGYLFVFYYESGALKVKRLNPAAPSTFETTVTLSSTVNTTTPTYDVMIHTPTLAVFAHNVEGAAEIKVGAMTIVPAVSSVITPVTVAEAGTNCIGLVKGPNLTVYLAYHNGTNGTRCTILNNGLATLHAPFTLEATTSPATVNITGYAQRDGSGVKFFYQVTAAATYNHFIKTNTASTGGVAGTAAVFLRSVGLMSKAFVYYGDNDTTDRAYFVAVHQSTLQSTYFVVRNDGVIIGKIQQSLASGLTTRPILANVSAASDAVFSFAVLNKTRLVSENATLFSLTGVSRSRVDFTNEQTYNYAQLGNNLHITGGVLSMYDGASVVEHGFHLYPENVSGADGSSGSMSDGDYNILAVYEWTDNFGQLHRSAPSPAVTVTVNGGGSTQKITATVPTLRLTAKNGTTRTNVSIAVYRTEAGPGEIYYRATSVTSPTMNDITADTVAVDLTISDTDLVSREILYTTGGVLENIAAPACSYICAFKNRLVLGGLENENEFWYSKTNIKGEAVEFSDAFAQVIEPEGGGIKGVWPLDDKALFFKNSRIYYIAGDGPDDTGVTNAYGEPERISSDNGIETFNSLVTYPGGILRKTTKGLYHLNPSLGDAYLGAPVEAFNDKTITSANLIPNSNQVRFTTSDGSALVYDYFFDQWGTATRHAARDGVIWKNSTFVFLKSSGEVLAESLGTYKDNGSPVGLKLTTAWLSMAGVLGFQRVYMFSMLADYKSPHTLLVRVGYDFSPAWEQIIVFNPATGLEINTYGSGATYGSVSPYGGSNSTYRLRSKLTKQKCQSIRFQIEELVTSATEGSQEGLVLTAMALEVGVKQGLTKLRAGQTVASATGGS